MTQQVYNPKKIEKKWQEKWDNKKLFAVKTDSKKKKYYLLEMLPYPSGQIHMGHVRNYSIGDVAARYKIMKGFNVLHPMGWDAFGLPAENAAINRGIHPAKWTYDNIDYMRSQLKQLGITYDWDREFATCDSSYYKWEQLIFIKMLEKGLVYKKTTPANWCVKCQTVLANEQVEAGRCWRCSSEVELKTMSQWFFKITNYAEELLSDIDDKLQGWPERVKIMQKEWIGKSNGAMIDFKIDESNDKIQVFTTRPDTLFGVTFMSLSCEHPLAQKLVKESDKKDEIKRFVEKTAKIDHKARLEGNYEKEGVFTGIYAINPANNQKVPVYIANFVLAEYGTGAVMAVPTHDQRDFEFAKKYNLPLKIVIEPKGKKLEEASMKEAYVDSGVMVNSGKFNGMSNIDAIKEITNYLKEKGVGDFAINFKLKDWCISRQRYWGAPIPIIYCDKCGHVPVPEKDLPIELPTDVEFKGEGGSPLAKVESFVNVKCPVCKAKAKRETDTMDTFVESSWYLLRYACPDYKNGPIDKKKISYWLPVDQYIGGIEHAVGHLMYCRFFTKVLRDLDILDLDEPVINLITQGMVIKDGSKMSKSKGNLVSCDEMLEKYGADSLRLFILFAAPPEKDLEWNDKGIEGMSRFLMRMARLVDTWCINKRDDVCGDDLVKKTNKVIKKVTEDMERYHFNTAIAALMEYVNYLYQIGSENICKQAIDKLLILATPFVPHMTEELWEKMGNKDFISIQEWPLFDKSMIKDDEIKIVIQVNGKLRDTIMVLVDTKEETIKEKAKTATKVIPYLQNKEIRKIIYVPNKLVNIVV